MRAESLNNASPLERLRTGTGEGSPTRRPPESEGAPRPRQGLHALGYRLVGHRPGKRADKTSDQPPSGCLPPLKDYLPFKLKKPASHASGADAVHPPTLLSSGAAVDAHVGPPTPSGLTEDQVRLIGVARWPDAKYNDEDSVNTGLYARRFHDTTREAASRIANGQIIDFKELWTFVSEARYDWAKISNDKNRDAFEPKRRDGDLLTALSTRYEYLAQRLKQERRSGQRQMKFERNPHYGTPRKPMAHRVFQAKETLDGQEIKLTTLRIAVKPSNFLAEPPSSVCTHWEAWAASIVHTAEQNIMPLMNHVGSLFDDLVSNPRPPEQVMEVLADVHWWLAHATPDWRGSAAKAEMAVRAMAGAHGIELPPFKRGIVPDMEAFPLDRATFRARYTEMFDGPIRHTPSD